MIKLEMVCVDGETVLEAETRDPKAALQFLEKQDHEGTTITLKIDTSDHHFIYCVLNTMANAKRKATDRQ
jgi:hypothetical protein